MAEIKFIVSGETPCRNLLFFIFGQWQKIAVYIDLAVDVKVAVANLRYHMSHVNTEIRLG
jgi:hypothetical protein